MVPFYTNVVDTPASFRDTGSEFNLQSIFWLNKLMSQLGDTNFKLYGELESAFEQKTVAACYQVQHQTDKLAQELQGAKLQACLTKANQEMADLTFANTVELLGKMVEEGHSHMQLKYDLLD